MADYTNKFLLATVFAGLCFSWTIIASDGPFIVAHKKATLTRVKSDIEHLSISIDIYNQGSATAYDVSLYDDNWSQDVFEIVVGNTSMSWERLDAGASLSHSFELEAKKKTVFYGAPAVITFRIPTKAALQEAFSTPILPLEILADRPPEKKFDWAKEVMGSSRENNLLQKCEVRLRTIDPCDPAFLEPREYWELSAPGSPLHVPSACLLQNAVWVVYEYMMALYGKYLEEMRIRASFCLTPCLQKLMAKYGSLISVISIVVLFVYLIATPSKASKKKR